MNPFLALPPETAHQAGIWALKTLPNFWRFDAATYPRLATQVCGLKFPNCLGLAAGFDKHAEVYNPLFGLGFGFVEVGSITPKPQLGNPKPRVFRLSQDGAVINRYGFNSHGLDKAELRLEDKPAQGILGLNFGKNKDTEEAALDYVAGIERLAQYASYLVINVSSPNTPGLRAEQASKRLRPLVQACLEVRRTAGQGHKPMFVKIAPDMTDAELEGIVELALETGIEGLIVSNTTIARPEALVSAAKSEAGGLSGRPLLEPSTQVLAKVARMAQAPLAQGRLALIGVGGVHDGASAYSKILHGASLVQLYSAMAFAGPGLIAKILSELDAYLLRDGFESVTEAVGAAV